MSVSRTVLVISQVHAGTFPADVTLVDLPYAAMTAQAISEILPDLVILPLVGVGFDAIEALSQLDRFGFRGEVLVRAPSLPNSHIVERELSAIAPGLSVRLIGPVS